MQPSRRKSIRLAKRVRQRTTRSRCVRFEPLESRIPLAADITAGLVHHWTFDETSGNTAADSAGDGDGTLINWAANEPKWVAGRVGGALRFDTEDNQVQVQPPAMSGSYAVSFWLNVKDKSGVNPRILASRTGNEIIVAASSNRSVGYFSGNSGTSSPEPSTFNTWEHFALNFNASTGQGFVYRSGVPVATGSFTDNASLATWFIGHSTNPTNSSDTLKGALDDLRVYNRLLNDEDIAALAALGTPEPIHQEPVHHWTFDETTGFTAHDTAGGADGILLNWNPTEPRWQPGIVGGALRFSTADNAVVTSAIATGAEWSTAFWLNVQSRSGVNPRIQEPAGGYINVESNRGVGFTSRNQHTFDPTPVTLDKWEQYTITYDTINDVGTIYRNGVAVKSGPFFDNAPASAWILGHQNDLGNHNDSLDGLLDDFRQYDRLLSPSEIQALAGAANPQPPTAGLIHHWTFDETIGTIAADIVGSNDAELRNYGPTQSTWVPGKIGGAISFTDADDLVITESPITEDQYTFSFWLNQTGDGGFNPRLINPGDEDWLVLWQFANRGIHFSDSQVWDPRMATRNTWEHYAVTLDQATNRVEFYRSGVLVASGVYPDKAPPIKQWVMGHSGTLTHHVDTLHGLLDEMRVYNRVLLASEVQLLANFQPLEARADAYSTREDVSLVVSTALGVQKNDSTAGASTRAIADVLPVHGQLSLNENGSFTYTPSKDWNGVDSFTYHLESGAEVTPPVTVTLTVTPINDPPSFTLRVPEFIVSDEMPAVIRETGAVVASERLLAWMMNRTAGPATALDEVGQSFTVSFENDNPSLFSVQPGVSEGRLRFTPAPNARGTALVTVTLQDSGGNENGGSDSAVQTFVITVLKPHPLHNVANPFDVTANSGVTANDVLMVINQLNAFGIQDVAASDPVGPAFLDVTGNNVIAADDALAIINFINAGGMSPVLPGAAAFVGRDDATQGNWQGKYGAAGYALASSVTTLPSFANVSFTVGFTDFHNYVPAVSTTDVRALVHPITGNRFAAEWTGQDGFTLNVNITDGQLHRVSLYMHDWGASGRTQRLEVLDAATGDVLDSQTLDSFGQGLYLTWSLRGNVKIRFTNLANGLNAVLSGIFFD